MVYILVEGKEDVHFIGYLLSKKLKFGKEIMLESGVIESDLYKIEWNGSHGIEAGKLLNLDEYRHEYTKILIINDADSDFNDRYDEIKKKLESNNLTGEIFLFPNNKDTGELEDLLCDCIPEDNNFIATCFSSFQECLQTNNDKIFINVPAVKGKIYTYVDVQLTKKERESRNNPTTCTCKDKDLCLCKNQYCFCKDSIWNFDCDAIKPLLDFLTQHIK